MVDGKLGSRPAGRLAARGWRLLKLVFLLLALVFVGLFLTSQWDELSTQSWRLHGGWLTAAILLLLLSWAVEIGIWRYLLAMLDGPLTGRMGYCGGARVWFLSAIVRYIPGNIWQPLRMTLLCQDRGIRAEATLISVILFQVATLLGVLPLAGVYLMVTGNLGMLTGGLCALFSAMSASRRAANVAMLT